MQPRDQINKASWEIVESIKDTVLTNLVTGAKTGQLKIEASQIQSILAVLQASIEAGYQKVNRSFMAKVDEALANHAMPELSSKKKSK